MNRKKSLSVVIPAIVFVSIAAGVVFGYFLADGNNEVSRKSGSEKLRQVIGLIDRMYVDSVNTDSIVDIVLKDVTNRLDPHSIYLTGEETDKENQELEGQYTGIGIAFSMMRDTPMVTRVFANGPSYGKLCPGDKILAVDGKNIIFTQFDSIPYLIKGKEGTKVKLKILRRPDTAAFVVEVNREKVQIQSVIGYMVDDSIGYIKITNFGRKTYNEFVNTAKQLQKEGMGKLILDLRGNPGGILGAVVKILDEFFDSQQLLCFLKSREKIEQKCYSKPGGLLVKTPVVVLIDNGSASASEILAGAMQDNDRAVIIGTRSFGKGLVQSEFDLGDGSSVRLTTARYYTPSGRSIQKSYDSYDAVRGHKLGHNIVDTAEYKTKNGRTVKGGGGIYPDVFVEDTLYASYLYRLKELDFIDKYGYQLCNIKRPEDLLRFASKKGYKDFAVVYSVMTDLLPTSDAYKYYNEHSVVFAKAYEILRNGKWKEYLKSTSDE